MRLFWIGLFGLTGVFCRYFVGLLVNKAVEHPFPTGTFLINIFGSFVIGLIYVLGVEKAALSENLRVGIMVGFLGGFTTFSSYALETVRLVEEGKLGLGMTYVLASTVTGLLAAFGGLFLARQWA